MAKLRYYLVRADTQVLGQLLAYETRFLGHLRPGFVFRISQVIGLSLQARGKEIKDRTCFQNGHKSDLRYPEKACLTVGRFSGTGSHL